MGLDETERLLKAHFPGLECACAGKDDAMHVFITEKDACAAVKEFLAEKTRLNSTAFHVLAVEEIPKNDAGKIQYAALEQYHD